MDELINTFKRLELQFDTAFINLLTKLGRHQEICYTKEDKNQEEDYITSTNDSYSDSEIEKNHVDAIEPDNNEEETNEEYSDEKDEETTENDDNEEYYSRNEKDLFSFIEPDLVQIALSQAKIMTKAFLYAEQTIQLEQRVNQLELENLKLRSNSMESIENNTKKDNAEKFNHENASKNVTNLLLLKNAIDQVINHETLIERKNNQIYLMRQKYENKISGLNLVASYLKKELAGRVQQLQLLTCDTINDDQSQNNEIIIQKDFFKIWNRITFEITLNRFKTLVRVAEINKEFDSIIDNKNDECNNLEHIQSTLLNTGLEIGTTKTDITQMGQVHFISIYLEKNQPLGLEIIGGNEHTPVMIWKILPESLAAMKGCFCPGDIILTIQSNDMIKKNLEDALKLIKEISGWCRFGILRIPIKNVEQYFDFELLHDDSYQLDSYQKQKKGN